MSLNHNPKIVTDGLIFHYDIDNIKKSYVGEPTTNLCNSNTTYSNWNNSGTATWSNNDTTIERVYSDIPVISMLKGTSGNSHISHGYAPLTAGLTYTVSTHIYIPSGTISGGSVPYMRTFPANTSRGSLAYNGSTNWNTWPRGQWIRVSNTFTNTAGDTYMYISCYLDTSGDKVYYTAPQVEQKAWPSTFTRVSTSRSTSQALKDMTGNFTITATSLTYDGENSFNFNGSSNYLSNSSSLIKSGGGWTVENWFKLDVVNSGSLYNFIGDAAITYNSWYWTVYQSKLALWNRSPGIWKYGSTTIQPNTWYCAAIVCNDAGTGYQFYLNGIAEGGDHVSYAWNASYASLQMGYIGRGDASNGRYFDGRLPNMKVYNRALTAAEIKQNFDSVRPRYGL